MPCYSPSSECELSKRCTCPAGYTGAECELQTCGGNEGGKGPYNWFNFFIKEAIVII